jgi:hypothetical protein
MSACWGEMMALAPKLALEQGCRPYPEGGFRVVVNTGAEGGQEVHHLHIHVMGGPRALAEGLNWPVVPNLAPGARLESSAYSLGVIHGFIFHLALADRSADRGDGVRHQEAQEHGFGSGGAVKGFKDGMKDGSAPEEKPAPPAGR